MLERIYGWGPKGVRLRIDRLLSNKSSVLYATSRPFENLRRPQADATYVVLDGLVLASSLLRGSVADTRYDGPHFVFKSRDLARETALGMSGYTIGDVREYERTMHGNKYGLVGPHRVDELEEALGVERKLDDDIHFRSIVAEADGAALNCRPNGYNRCDQPFDPRQALAEVAFNRLMGVVEYRQDIQP